MGVKGGLLQRGVRDVRLGLGVQLCSSKFSSENESNMGESETFRSYSCSPDGAKEMGLCLCWSRETVVV